VVANRLNNLGSVLAEQNKMEEAEEMTRRALAARQAVSGLQSRVATIK
jgi:Tfp pilus assembly protein PilF